MYDSRITAIEQKLEHVHEGMHFLQGQVNVILNMHKTDFLLMELTHRLKVSTDALSKAIKHNCISERS